MKKSTKLLALLLAVIMVVALVPSMALAEEVEPAADTQGIIDTVIGAELPTYLVYCKLSTTNLPAANAQITLTNNANKDSHTYTANALGLALIPKGLLGIYNVAATCNGPLTGMKYSSVAGLKWSMSMLPDVDTLVLYPVLDIGLNYSDHFAYMIGYNSTTVGPNRNITRGEIATMIFRILTPEARNKIFTKTNNFSDVNASNVHNNAISSLAKAGILKGTGNGKFSPNAVVTREQFCAMIGRMFSYEYTGSNLFGDINGSFAKNYINLLGMLGIIKGEGNGMANPTAPLTRAQCAAMINRLLGRQSAAESISALTDTSLLKTWKDCQAGAWYYADIMEATNSHYYTWSTDVPNVGNQDTVIFEAWTTLRTDTPNWVDLQK